MTRLMLNSAGLKQQLSDQNLSSVVHSRELLAEGNLSFQMVGLLKFFFFFFLVVCSCVFVSMSLFNLSWTTKSYSDSNSEVLLKELFSAPSS